ncbi:ATP binding cassette protein [Artemisia annua]|uniref:ATP binding cassette protein n=1 Tax=Artemisia annua TaxID=35608 RepID=A0A2U1PK88_ARTAN|nr:ATP binding cassette protein [Artemisia annua]
MSSLKAKDIGKLLNGLSLVAKEAIRRSDPNVQSLIRQAVLSVTDISGLTKGQTTNFTPSKPNAISDENNTSNSSVVYFDDNTTVASSSSSADNDKPLPIPVEQSTVIADVAGGGGDVAGGEEVKVMELGQDTRAFLRCSANSS